MKEEFDPIYHIPINPSAICTRAFELMQSKQYEEAEKLLHSNLSKVDDDVAVGIFHSALGVLFKLKGETKTAYKHYQRAEKLIPEDPALKIITARLLIEQFAEYDQAIKRSKKVLAIIPDNPVFRHQAYITMGLAYLGKANKKKAIELLGKSVINDFHEFVSAKNIDFNLVEMLLRKGLAVKESKAFIEKALIFARSKREEMWIELTERMLAAFPEEELGDNEEQETA